MFGIGGSEFIIIAIIALIFLGPDKLPEATKKISRGIRELKKGTRTIQATIENDEHIGGAIRDLKSALRGEEPAPRPKRRKVKKKVRPVLDEAAATEAAEAKDELVENVIAGPPAEAAPAVKLPPTAGEPHHDTPAATPPGEDEAELAKLVRPASGTVAKSAGAHSDSGEAGEAG
jgi:sec-independent protein translocase protein TatB